MTDLSGPPGRSSPPAWSEAVDIIDVLPGDHRFEAVVALAASVLEQDRYVVRQHPHATESHVLAAFDGDECLGFLRFLVQVIGTEESRPPVVHHGVPLTEAYVEAFGVDPRARRRGIGSSLQDRAINDARAARCHQMRSRSPVTSVANYALKIAAGYVLSPSEQNDSYYFLRKL